MAISRVSKMEHHEIMLESEAITANLRAQLKEIEQLNEFCDQAVEGMRALYPRANPEPQIEALQKSERVPSASMTS
jgi:hypothetical protein